MVQSTGLRERKRFTTMRRVQNTALDLFDEHGYARVTIEQIAEVAEVSASSVYRYFGTKEGVLLWNPHHEDAVEQLSRPSPDDDQEMLLTSLRRLAAAVLTDDAADEEGWQRRRLRYLLGEPAISAALVGRLEAMGRQVAELLAGRTGRTADDLELQVTIGATIGALFGALRAWHVGGHAEPLAEVIDAALATLHDGLPLLRR